MGIITAPQENTLPVSQHLKKMRHYFETGETRDYTFRQQQLKKFKQVASVSDEHIERGGDGITVVVLK